jgi:hypothetical protein
MAGYVRQSSFVDGDTITAALFNDEYNQLVNAFHNSTGHAHDGTAASGPVIGLIGDAGETSPNNKVLIDTSNNYIEFYVEVSSNPVQQLYIADGAIIPVTDNDIDLGTSSLEFKDLYLDGTAHIDTLDVDANAGIIGNATVGGTLDVTGNTTLTANLTVNGNTTLGNAASDTVTITADVASDIIPSADSTHTLGDSSNYWSHGYIDAITTTGNVAVGGNLTVTGTTTFNGGTITMGDAATDNVVFGADVDSHIIPDDDDTYDLGSSSQEWRNLYIDGTANIDSLVADTADINGGTIDGATIATSDITVGSGKTLDVSSGTLTLANDQISGDKVEGGTIAATTITTLTSTTGNITGVNATTVDTTNIELTNLKAKDGTSAGSIADSTGVVTLASSVLTTTDINGGTIDGATIGANSASTGAFTTLTTSGNATVGGNLTVTGTTTFNGGTITMGDAATDNVVFGADVDSHIIPDDDDTYDLGSASQQWRNLYIDGTAEIDTLAINGTTVTSTAAELNILDGVTATAAEINVLDGITSTVAELNILDGVTASAADINLIDGITNGTVIASKAIITDSNKDITGGRNITISGQLAAATLDISGDVDIDGTLEADAITVNGTTLAETISDTVGAMVTSNTETGVTVTYDDSDNTLDFVIGTLNQDTTGNAATATALETARTIHGVSFDGTANIDLSEVVQDTVGAMFSSNTETGLAVTYEDGDGTIDLVLNAAQPTITSLGTLTTLTVDDITINGSTISDAGDLTIDVGGDVIIDADGDNIFYKAGGSSFYSISNVSGDAYLGVEQSDKDLIIRGNDGGSTITALTLDMSDAGTATFNNSVNVGGNLAVTGNLTINGTTTTVNSTTVTVDDPIFTLGGDSAPGSDDNKDRGIEFRWHNGSAAKVGFFGYDDSASVFTFIPDATNTSEVFSGSAGNVSFGSITGTGLTIDTSTLVVDSSNNRVGIGNASPDVSLDIGSNTDAVHVPVGTTAQRPGSPAAGYFRYNTSLSQFEGYTDAWGAIGGGGTNTFTHDVFTGNGSTTAYALSQSTESENNLIVFIDGVFQEQSAYSIATSSGTTTLTFSAAPANGRKIVVYTVAAGVSGSNLNIDTMTGDGSDTTLTLSIAPVNENNTQVFFDGVYQNKSTYSISGTTLTFSTAPPTGVAVEVMTFTQTDINVPVDGTITSAKLSGDLTLPGHLTLGAGKNISNASGNLTIDVAGTLVLDADGAILEFQDGGTSIGTIESGSQNLNIKTAIADKDIRLQGFDGDLSTLITAVNFDMSEAGAATFNSTISSGAITSSGNISLGGADGDNAVLSLTANTGNWVFTNVQSNRNLEISDSDGTGIVFTIDTSGNVGIGENNPSNVLDLGSATQGRALTFSNYSNLGSEYSNASLWLSSNFYLNSGSSGYKVGSTGNFGAAGVRVHGTGGSGNNGIIEFYADTAASKTGGDAFTPTRQVRINSLGAADSATLQVFNPLSNAFNHVQENLVSGLTNGETAYLGLGKANSAKNTGYVGYTWDSDASNDNYIHLSHWGSNSLFRVYGNGDYSFAGSNVSDRDKKENIKEVSGTSLDKITQIPIKSFRMKSTLKEGEEIRNQKTGFIAQEVQPHLPDVVTGTDGEGNMGIDPVGITAHLVRAIQELSTKLDAAEARIKTLEG